MADFSVGATVAGCRIEGIAGRGGMGVVYRATQLALERPVALKLIAAELTEDLAFRERFKRESMIAAAIEHPNVIPVYEAGERDDQLYIIMRYVEGTDLRAMLVREGPLEPQRAADLLSQVAAALGAAHRRGLVHRDVKPANVLITRDDEREHVYLTDFGIARHVASVAGVTRTGSIVGTIDYLAPERIEGERGDATADVYALGCMLYETLTGGIPYPRDTDVAKIYAHLNAEIPSIGDQRPHLPDELQDVVHRALEKDPARRFESSGEFGRAVTAAATAAPRPSSAAAFAEAPPAEPAPQVATDETTAPTEHDLPTSDELSPPPPPPPPDETVALERDEDVTETHPPPDETSALDPEEEVAEAPPPRPPEPPEEEDEESAAPPPQERRPAAAPVGGGGRVPLILGALLIAGVVIAVVLLATGGGGSSNGKLKNLPAIPVGGKPDGVTVGAGQVWVANGPQNAVNRIDPKRIKELKTDKDGKKLVVQSPRYAAGIDPDTPVVVGQRLWVTNTGSNDVRALDVNTGKPTGPRVVNVGEKPEGLTFGAGSLWVANAGNGNIERIDEATGRAMGKTPVGPGNYDVAFGSGHVWATSADQGTVTRIDPTNKQPPLTIRVGKGARGVAVGGGAVWVANSVDNSVSKVDLSKSPPRQTKAVKVANYPYEVTYGAGSVWVTSRHAGVATRIDAGSAKVLDQIAPGHEPIGLAVDGRILWVACWGSGGIRPIKF